MNKDDVGNVLYKITKILSEIINSSHKEEIGDTKLKKLVEKDLNRLFCTTFPDL